MIRTIYIAWRQRSEEKRYLIARIKRTANGISFQYLRDFEVAKRDGLDFLFGFKDENKLTPAEIQSLLSLRVISKDRTDKNEFLKFWEAEGVDDTFDLLGLTQGKSPTDNFEFLADFLTTGRHNITFVTDLLGIEQLKLKAGLVKVGDILNYEINNISTKTNTSIFVNKIKVGNIKPIHSRVFESKRKLKLTVKAVDENEFIKQIYIKVEQ